MIPDKLEMDQKLVREWLTEYKALPGSGMPAFARKISSNVELLKALFHVLNSSSSVYQDSVCSQLYEFYRSGHHELKRFCIQFVPLLVWQYLRSIAMQETIGRIESLLLGIYNLEVVEADGTPKAETFTIPTLARPSIFHEPMSPLSLSDNLLLSHQNDHTVLTRGPFPQISTVNAQNRGSILCHVLSQYNADIGFLSSLSLQSMCAAYSRLALTGFSNSIPGHPSSSSSSSKGQRSKGADLHLNLHNHPRIPLSPNILLEMMTGVYFAMFNGHATAATQALEDIHFRASYELYAEVLLVTNAIKNSLETNPSGRPSDGPVGINIAVTPASPVVKRAAITNASFKNRRNKDTPNTTTTTITVMIEGVEKGDRRLPRSAEKIIVRKTNSDHVTDDLRSPHNRGNQEFHENGTEPDEAHPLLKQRTSRSLEGLELNNISNSTLATNGKSVEHSPYNDTHSARTSPSSTTATYERSRSKENLHRSEDNLRSGDLSPTEKTELMDGLRVTYSGINGAKNSNSNSSSAGGSRNSVSYETTL